MFDRKNIVFISDFEIDRDGEPMTGYSNISCSYGRELSKYHNIIALGISYRRNQHSLPFGITQVSVSLLLSSIMSIYKGTDGKIKDFIFCLDIPMISSLLKKFEKPKDMKIYGYYAVEGDPLIFSWASQLMLLDKRYVISGFGEEECKKAYVDAKHLVVPLDLLKWKKRIIEEQMELKNIMGLSNKKVIFINADSNERKNISAMLQGYKKATESRNDLHLILLTRVNSQVGHNYDDLLSQLNLVGKVTMVNRGITKEEVRKLYAVSDLLINTSKSEGLGMSLLEAMAVGVPVIATNCTAMRELGDDDRVRLLDAGFINIDVFGNTNRYYVFPDNIANAILEELDKDQRDRIESAYEYILDRNDRFLDSIQILLGDLNEQKE